MIYLKNKKQIEKMRKSGELAAKTLKHIEPFVVAGVTTEYLNNEIEKFIRDNGAIPACLNYKGFPASCCISINEVICHGIPDKRTLKDGDILNIDVTTILDGWYGDTSTMFSVGEISEDAKKIISVTKEALRIGIEQVRPGNYLGNIGYEINKYATSQGCSVVYQFTAHGTGFFFFFHEEPFISHIAPKDSGIKMRRGMTFTIEPMLNLGKPEAIISEVDGWTATTIDGKLSAQFEHTILVTEQGYEILTKLKHDNTF